MTDNYEVFWQNNERARALFYDLLARAQREEYDDDFLARLAAYREAGGDSPHADIFAAQYLLHEGDAQTALVCAERAYRVCPLEPCVWQALGHAYNATGHYAEALVMQCRRANLFELSFSLSYPRHVLTEDVCARMSIALGLPIRAPLCTQRLSLDENGELRRSRAGMFMGEFLPQDAADRPPYYVGVYTEQGLFGAKTWQAEAVRTAPGCAVFGGGDMVFDLMRARRVSSAVTIDLETPSEIILPIMGTGKLQVPIIPQQLRVKTASVDGEAWISPATTNYFRLTESAVLSSNAAFIVGTRRTQSHTEKTRAEYPRRCPPVEDHRAGLCRIYAANASLLSKRDDLYAAFLCGRAHLFLHSQHRDGNVRPSHADFSGQNCLCARPKHRHLRRADARCRLCHVRPRG